MTERLWKKVKAHSYPIKIGQMLLFDLFRCAPGFPHQPNLSCSWIPSGWRWIAEVGALKRRHVQVACQGFSVSSKSLGNTWELGHATTMTTWECEIKTLESAKKLTIGRFRESLNRVSTVGTRWQPWYKAWNFRVTAVWPAILMKVRMLQTFSRGPEPRGGVWSHAIHRCHPCYNKRCEQEKNMFKKKKHVSNSFGIIILAMELVGSHNVRQLKYGFCPVRQSSQQAYTVETRLGKYKSFNAKQSTRCTVL